MIAIESTQTIPLRHDGEPFLSRSAAIVAVLLFVMFGGMMHDFRSYKLSSTEIADSMFRSSAAFDKDVTAALPERKAAFVLAAFLAVYCLSTCNRAVVWQSRLTTTLAVLSMAWIAMSLSWSVSPSETMRELVRVSVYTALVYGISIRFTPLEVFKILLVTSCLTVGFSICFAIFVGQQTSVDDVYRLGGSLHPNPLARFSMIVAISSLAFARQSAGQRWKWIGLLILAMVVIQLTKSRTALASCMLGLAVVFLVGFEFRRLLFPGVLFCTVISFLVVGLGIRGESGFSSLGNIATMGRNEKVESLTGRLPLWEALLDHSKDRRMIGFGYGAFWNAKMNAAIQNDRRVSWYPGHAHSCYVELLVNVGLIGVSLITFAGISAFIRSSILARSNNQVEYVIASALLASAFVNGITESGFILPRELAIVSGIWVLTIAQQPIVRDASRMLESRVVYERPIFSRPAYAR